MTQLKDICIDELETIEGGADDSFADIFNRALEAFCKGLVDGFHGNWDSP